MKMPRKIIWKSYVFIFTIMSLANLTWLLNPKADPYVFYHMLMVWTPFYILHYCLAIFKSCISLFCLIPVVRFAFNQEPVDVRFWQWIFGVRIITEIFGNFYEFLFIKSAYHMVPDYGLTVTGAFLLPLLPSYIAHFLHVFNKKI